MSAVFKKPIKHRWLAELIALLQRRRALLVLFLFAVALAAMSYYGIRSAERRLKLLSAAEEVDAAFDAAAAYQQAQELIKEAQANEFRGRRSESPGKYIEALKLLDEIKKKAPSYKPEEVAGKALLCENKVRKVK